MQELCFLGLPLTPRCITPRASVAGLRSSDRVLEAQHLHTHPEVTPLVSGGYFSAVTLQQLLQWGFWPIGCSHHSGRSEALKFCLFFLDTFFFNGIIEFIPDFFSFVFFFSKTQEISIVHRVTPALEQELNKDKIVSKVRHPSPATMTITERTHVNCLPVIHIHVSKLSGNLVLEQAGRGLSRPLL